MYPSLSISSASYSPFSGYINPLSTPERKSECLTFADTVAAMQERQATTQEFYDLAQNVPSELSALQRAHFFEFVAGLEQQSRLQDPSTFYEKAIHHYIEAAKEGDHTAVEWLEKQLLNESYFSLHEARIWMEDKFKAQIYLALGDLYAALDRGVDVVAEKYNLAAALLRRDVERGLPYAVMCLNNPAMSTKLGFNTPQYVEQQLAYHIEQTLANDQESKRWLLNIFQKDAILPETYRQQELTAMLTVMQCMSFSTYPRQAWCLGRSDVDLEPVRQAMVSRLKSIMGENRPELAIAFYSHSYNHQTLIITINTGGDDFSFIKQTPLSKFFADSFRVGLDERQKGLGGCGSANYKNCLVITDVTWPDLLSILGK
jgi:hypothetical protein